MHDDDLVAWLNALNDEQRQLFARQMNIYPGKAARDPGPPGPEDSARPPRRGRATRRLN